MVNYLTNVTYVTSIVPRLPPAIDGVGDYALNLARQLRKDFNVQTYFIVGDHTWSGAAEIEGFPVSQISDHSPNTLLNLLSTDRSYPILLHYVGYGYAQRGCPVWLVDGLQRWKSLFPKRSLVTMFHEISASGTIWTSAFWLSSLQLNLAARLAQMSDHCITSKQSYAEILYKLGRSRQPKITHVPIFSTIGEPEKFQPFADRYRRLVVFGHRNSRLQVYQQCRTGLEQICQALEIIEICDIGVPTNFELSEINGIPIVKKGLVEAAEVSKILLDSVAGFLNVPPPKYLAKSTIFAAYCAHKLIPCMVSYSTVPIDGLQNGKHYWSTSAQSQQLCLEVVQEIAHNAYCWYQTHNLPAQTKIFANYLMV